MSGLSAWIWGTSQLDDAVDKATSELLPAGGEDIALNLEICDQIRSKSVPAKDAMRALKRRLNHKNPNVQLAALSLTDICIKNGGDLFLVEIASREFIDNLVSILKIPSLNHEVKGNVLRLMQNWSVAFEGKTSLNYVGQVYKNLLSEGYRFPPKDLAVANSAMVDTQTAPEWIDSELCLRCRTPFSFTNRKHHCRNCGQVFDQACSSKVMTLPHFGITQEVRVCDGCHSKLTKKAEKVDKGHRHSTVSTRPHVNHYRSPRELADAELQRAIQLSLQEARNYHRPGYVAAQPSSSGWNYSEPPLIDRSTYPDRKMATVDEEDSDLKAAIEASLREAAAPKPSAPVVVEQSEPTPYPYASYSSPRQSSLPKLPNFDLNPLEADAILSFNQTVEQVQAQGGRDLSRYPAVTDLYDKANSLRPKLALSLDDAGRKEQMLSDMHDQLSQAVKLYDQILSQQVAHPRWRTSSIIPASPPQVQQQPANYAPSGYNQWAGQQQPIQSSYQPQKEPMSPQSTYAAPPVVEQHSQYGMVSHPEPQSYQRPQQVQPVYQPPAQLHNSVSYPPAAPTNLPSHLARSNTVASHSPAPQPEPQSYQHPQQVQPAYQPPAQLHNSVSYLPAAPTNLPSHLARSNTVASHSPVPQPEVQSYQHPQQVQPVYQPSAQLHNSVSYSPAAPTNLPSHLARSNTVTSHSPAPQPEVQSYQHPQQVQPVYQPPAQRHNSVSYSPAVTTSLPSHLARSNTVASHAPAPQFQQASVQQQGLQQITSSPPVPALLLSQFPSVPTSAPQPTFSTYNSSVHQGFERKEERQEVPLIDL